VFHGTDGKVVELPANCKVIQLVLALPDV